MPAKKKSSSTSVPDFQVTLIRRDGAPPAPTRDALVKHFARTWNLVPKHRRPQSDEKSPARRIACDVLYVDDAEISGLNVTHLKVTGPTDVLSFPMGEYDPERRALNLGEIVVSFTTAAREAIERELSQEEELARYCIHGFLHLLGYEDATNTQREEMFEIQEEALKPPAKKKKPAKKKRPPRKRRK